MGMGLKSAPGLPDLPIARYTLNRHSTAGLHPYVNTLENGVIYGQAVARGLLQLKTANGFEPDVVLAHPGWGEALFIKDVFPKAKLINLFEFFYHSHGVDVGFDPDDVVTVDDQARIRTRNALHLLNLEYCDAGISPTYWQKSVHPDAYKARISVIHEGIDTDYMAPDAAATFTLPDGRILRRGDPVVTYVGRNLEPYRGFKTLMRSLPTLLARHPAVEILIVGADGISYGKAPADGKTWREVMLDEVGGQIDLDRVHFVGRIPYDQFRSMLQISAAHIYLTYPFVLSWSMLEAMSCGALVIGSATAPVEEVIRHGRNGLLVDIFNPEELAEQVLEVLAHPQQFEALRRHARQTIAHQYNLHLGNAGYERLIESVCASR